MPTRSAPSRGAKRRYRRVDSRDDAVVAECWYVSIDRKPASATIPDNSRPEYCSPSTLHTNILMLKQAAANGPVWRSRYPARCRELYAQSLCKRRLARKTILCHNDRGGSWDGARGYAFLHHMRQSADWDPPLLHRVRRRVPGSRATGATRDGSRASAQSGRAGSGRGSSGRHLHGAWYFHGDHGRPAAAARRRAASC